MSKVESYIARFGSAAGPKIYHALQSRSAYIGVNTRRRDAIAALTGRPTRARRTMSGRGQTPLLPEESASVDQGLNDPA